MSTSIRLKAPVDARTAKEASGDGDDVDDLVFYTLKPFFTLGPCEASCMSYMFYVTCDLPMGHEGDHAGESNWGKRETFTEAQTGVWTCFGTRATPKGRRP